MATSCVRIPTGPIRRRRRRARPASVAVPMVAAAAVVLLSAAVDCVRLPLLPRLPTPAGRSERRPWRQPPSTWARGRIIDGTSSATATATARWIDGEGGLGLACGTNVPRGGAADFADDGSDDGGWGSGNGNGNGGGGNNGGPWREGGPPPPQLPGQDRWGQQHQRQQQQQQGGYGGYGPEPDLPPGPGGGRSGGSGSGMDEPPLPGGGPGGNGNGNGNGGGGGGYGGGGPPPPSLPGGPLGGRYGPPPLPRAQQQQRPQQHQQHQPGRGMGGGPAPPQYGQQQQLQRREGPPPPRSAHPPGVGPAPPSSSGPLSAQQQQQPQPLGPSSSDSSSTVEPMDLSQFDKDMIFKGLKRMYRKKIMPLEISSKYGHFHSSPLSPSDFEAKPMVLLLGQYSVGKTSFIRYLLGRDFPGIRIGPEPTTDRFTAIMHGDVDKITPGAALCSQADRPFRGLSPFGNNFLSRLEGVEMDSPILKNITLVDTPGILSGQKQSMGRNYDYEAVMKWFAERADLIVIMFDAHKLDISDELKRVIELMKPHADKVRVVLNKADCVSTQQLMRVYGALMWSLGKVMNTPEVCRVYIGSFWGVPLQNTEQARLLTQEKMDLFNDIAQLPQNAVMRRINELVKRARSVKVHAYIIHYLRKQLPYTWGKREKQARLIERLEKEFIMCARRYELPRGDFPDIGPFRQALKEIKDLSEFPKLDKKMVKEMDKVFSVDIPELLEKARGH